MNLELARFNMIEQQIRPWDVLDQRVLDIMASVPREAFVPEAYRDLAFADIEIPIGEGQTMLFPRVEGRILQALAPKSGETALVVGTGTGFLTACIARLAGQVHSVDIRGHFVEAARERLAAQGITNASLSSGDAASGWPNAGGYDVIAVTGSVPEYCDVFEQQLRPGGRLFLVVGEAPVMEAMLVTRGEDNGGCRREFLFETCLTPLDGVSRRPVFTL